MTTEVPKTSPTISDHSFQYPPPHQASGGTYPPSSYTQFYPYPAPADSSNSSDANAALPGPQFVPFPPPPQDVASPFSHPPSGQALPSSPSVPIFSVVRPKRKQVKMACTNCATACKRCDDSRPCERCTKYGLMDSCVDGQRKERKKGLKRGPYKRRTIPGSNESPGTYPQQSGEGEWQFPNNQAQAHNPATNMPAAFQHVAFATPEGYPYYYAPPGFMPSTGYVPAVNDSQTAPEGGPNVNGQPQLMIPYYIHPGSYPPFSYYPPLIPGGYTHHCVPLPSVLGSLETPKKADPQGDTDRSSTGPGTDNLVPVGKKKAKVEKNKTAASRLQNGNQVNGAGEGLTHDERGG